MRGGERVGRRPRRAAAGASAQAGTRLVVQKGSIRGADGQLDARALLLGPPASSELEHPFRLQRRPDAGAAEGSGADGRANPGEGSPRRALPSFVKHFLREVPGDASDARVDGVASVGPPLGASASAPKLPPLGGRPPPAGFRQPLPDGLSSAGGYVPRAVLERADAGTLRGPLGPALVARERLTLAAGRPRAPGSGRASHRDPSRIGSGPADNAAAVGLGSSGVGGSLPTLPPLRAPGEGTAAAAAAATKSNNPGGGAWPGGASAAAADSDAKSDTGRAGASSAGGASSAEASRLGLTDDADLSEMLREGGRVTNGTVQEVCSALPGLTSLGLAGCVEVSDAGMWAIARESPGLSKLVLSGLPLLTHVGLRSVSLRCRQLTWLDLSRCPAVDDMGLRVVASGLWGLHTLHMRDCAAVHDGGVAELAQCCRRLTDVDVSRCPMLTDKALQAIARYCTEEGGLRRFAFASSRFCTDTGFAALAAASPLLEALNLSSCAKLSGGDGLAAFAASCPRLHTLALDGCEGISSAHIGAAMRSWAREAEELRHQGTAEVDSEKLTGTKQRYRADWLRTRLVEAMDGLQRELRRLEQEDEDAQAALTAVQRRVRACERVVGPTQEEAVRTVLLARRAAAKADRERRRAGASRVQALWRGHCVRAAVRRGGNTWAAVWDAAASRVVYFNVVTQRSRLTRPADFDVWGGAMPPEAAGAPARQEPATAATQTAAGDWGAAHGDGGSTAAEEGAAAGGRPADGTGEGETQGEGEDVAAAFGLLRCADAPGWFSGWDAESGAAYWWNSQTGDYRWEAPWAGGGAEDALASSFGEHGGERVVGRSVAGRRIGNSAWVEMYDAVSKAAYYFNEATEESAWSLPPGAVAESAASWAAPLGSGGEPGVGEHVAGESAAAGSASASRPGSPAGEFASPVPPLLGLRLRQADRERVDFGPERGTMVRWVRDRLARSDWVAARRAAEQLIVRQRAVIQARHAESAAQMRLEADERLLREREAESMRCLEMLREDVDAH
ncbi:hypothetical protein FNF28_07096 [Cafeteria roenbergensis]|uniref:WW domain-containing protein n=1 Tax=Cafeteria roenbergensis TaxID=33653 RepID=A0A5A8CFH5_CAFRO|nr:hypothetical protein FNF28_07096 [Cafeteria roenbergensis]